MVSQAFKDNYSGIDWKHKKFEPKKKVRIAQSKRSHLPAPRIVGDYEAYNCPITGELVEGRAAHRENLKKHGCRVFEAGEFQDVKQNGRERINQQIDAAVDKAVDEIAKDFI